MSAAQSHFQDSSGFNKPKTVKSFFADETNLLHEMNEIDFEASPTGVV